MNKERQVKIWEDVDDNTKSILEVEHFDTIFRELVNVNINSHYLGEKIAYKVIATVQIAKLIELGYGGRISKTAWEDPQRKKYGIISIPASKKLVIKELSDEYCFVAFHTQQQAEEFMSHESNRNIIKNYYMI